VDGLPLVAMTVDCYHPLSGAGCPARSGQPSRRERGATLSASPGSANQRVMALVNGSPPVSGRRDESAFDSSCLDALPRFDAGTPPRYWWWLWPRIAQHLALDHGALGETGA